MISQELKDSCRGRWKDILVGVGVDAKILNGEHQPCPLCGGRDRFRWTNHENDGTYYCNQCGSGTGFHLAHKLTGKDYPEICKEIEGMIKGGMPKARTNSRENKLKAERAQKIWEESVDLSKDDPVCRYLIGRGLKTASTTLRFHSGIFDGGSGKNYPSMVAPISSPKDEMIGIHITHLEESGTGNWIKAGIENPKKQRKIARTISGGAIRLWKTDPDDGIGIAEGIETALAAREMLGIPCWSVMNATGMEKFKIPIPPPRRLTIFADNDKNFVGMRAAYNLANRLVIKDDYHAVFIEHPMIIGDFLDEMNATYVRAKL